MIDAAWDAGRHTLLEQEALDEFLPKCERRSVAIVDRVRRLEAVRHDHGVALRAAAIQFVVAGPAISALPPGARAAAQSRQDVDWIEASIPAEFWTDLKTKGLIREDAPASPR